MNRRTTTAVPLVTLLSASACGAAPDDPDPQGSATTEPQRSGSGPDTACTVVGRDGIAPLNPQDEIPVSELLVGDHRFDGCSIGTVPSISVGIRVIDGGDSLRDRVAGIGDDTLEEIDGLGDEAFRSERVYDGRTTAIAIGVRQGEHEVLLRNWSFVSVDEDEHVSEEAMIEFLQEYVAAIPDDFESQARRVPIGSGCPSEIDPAVNALIGNVELARGGDTGDAVQCTYVGSTGSTIRLSRFATDDPAAYLAPLAPPDYVPVTVEGTTAAMAWLFGNAGYLTIQPSATEIAELETELAGGAVEQERFLALATTFLSESAP